MAEARRIVADQSSPSNGGRPGCKAGAGYRCRTPLGPSVKGMATGPSHASSLSLAARAALYGNGPCPWRTPFTTAPRTQPRLLLFSPFRHIYSRLIRGLPLTHRRPAPRQPHRAWEKIHVTYNRPRDRSCCGYDRSSTLVQFRAGRGARQYRHHCSRTAARRLLERLGSALFLLCCSKRLMSF